MREERSRKGEQPGRQKLRESRQAAISFKKRKKYLGQVTSECESRTTTSAPKNDIISGGNGEGVPPVPIPNTEVKPFSAESTWLDTAREDRSPPDST